jgi:hypothetical protein
MTDEPQQQPRSEAPRQHNRPQHRHYREQRQRSPGSQQAQTSPGTQQAPTETKETRTPGLDDADTEEDTASRQSQPRGHRGRPEKKKYEEWANDPYCN